jgi:hypothetical protein
VPLTPVFSEKKQQFFSPEKELKLSKKNIRSTTPQIKRTVMRSSDDMSKSLRKITDTSQAPNKEYITI